MSRLVVTAADGTVLVDGAVSAYDAVMHRACEGVCPDFDELINSLDFCLVALSIGVDTAFILCSRFHTEASDPGTIAAQFALCRQGCERAFREYSRKNVDTVLKYGGQRSLALMAALSDRHALASRISLDLFAAVYYLAPKLRALGYDAEEAVGASAYEVGDGPPSRRAARVERQEGTRP